MGDKNGIILTTFVFLISSVLALNHKESFCGEKDADKSKTCISVRLPWQESPIYFCTEKANIPYKDRCTDHLARYCASETPSTSLMVATPWDCCALTSTPDMCAERSCPSPPFNRTCKKIEPDSTRPWECCPSYLCDEEDASSCQMKRLTPECRTPPKDKINCVAFRDEHGCCNKFQCDGDGKPGMCPMQIQANHLRRMLENTSPAPGMLGTTTSSPSISTSMPPISGSTSAPTGFSQTTNATGIQIYPHVMDQPAPGHGVVTDLRCVGDFNCPGQMKCCSPIMSTYYNYDNAGHASNGRYGTSKDPAVYGLCVEPVIMKKM